MHLSYLNLNHAAEKILRNIYYATRAILKSNIFLHFLYIFHT